MSDDEGRLRLGDLGPGWEGATAALAAVQADLTRTVPDAPTLVLLWTEREDDLWPTGVRHAYVGKSRSWYFGANGGFPLHPTYTEALLAIVEDVQDAVVDSLLGPRGYWPHCPVHTDLLVPTWPTRQNPQVRWWCGREGAGHALAEIGSLGVSLG
jgi:hypothetical protein